MTDNKLINDPKRDAGDSIRGYVYQAYQSVLTWMSLEESEIMILEGAEDFDVYEKESDDVVVTQVKDVSSNLTLRSGSIVDAINNFWTHRSKNPDHKIKFVFLSTASEGNEQGDPFGNSQSGLEVWKNVARGNEKPDKLKAFLNSTDINQSLKDFLSQASDEEITTELLSKIEWHLNKRPITGLQLLLESKLVHFGAHLGISASHSKKALSHLLKHVALKLSDKERSNLQFSDFAQEFENATQTVVPQAELNRLKALEAALPQARKATPTSLIMTPPPLLRGATERNLLASKLKKIMETDRLLFLAGGSGFGKTSLASLIADNVQEDWGWCSFRGLDGAEIRERLQTIETESLYNNGPIHIVLDDIDLKNTYLFERELVSFIYGIKNANGIVVLTGQILPPQDIPPKLWASESCCVSVPPFTDQDIEDLLSTHGMNNSQTSKVWATYIKATTYGHPQLVHAKIRGLQMQNWPSPKEAMFETTGTEKQVKSQARRRLVQELPSESSRQLAYRLSLISGSFSRNTAISIAKAPPPISRAGEAFDDLVGPWVEEDSSNHYRISPLLSGVANENLSTEEIAATHLSIVESILESGKVNYLEIGTLLMHAILGKSPLRIVQICNSFLTRQTDEIERFSYSLSWFAAIALEKGKAIYEEDPLIETYLRITQYRVSDALGRHDSSEIILHKLLTSIDRCPDALEKPPLELLAYGNILSNSHGHIRAKTVVALLSRTIDISKDVYTNEAYLVDGHAIPSIDIDGLDPTQALFSFQATRTSDIYDLEELFDSLLELDDSKREYLLSVTEIDTGFSDLLINNPSIREVDQGRMDTNETLRVLRKIKQLSTEWKKVELLHSVICAEAVILDEYQNTRTDALVLVTNALAQHPESAKLLSQKGKVLDHLGKYREAKKAYIGSLALNKLNGIDSYFTGRAAGICSAKIDDWSDAEKLFMQALARSQEYPSMKLQSVGIEADIAVCQWRLGKHRKSLSTFGKVALSLQSIPNEDDLQARHLHATVRHSIAWIHFDIIEDKKDSSIYPPLPGMCSNPNPNEGLKNLPILPLESTLHLLSLTEQKMEIDGGIQEILTQAGLIEIPTFIQIGKRLDNYRKTFKGEDILNFVPTFIAMKESADYSKSISDDFFTSPSYEIIPKLPKDYWLKPENIEVLFQNIIEVSLVFISLFPSQPLPINKWKTDFEALAIKDTRACRVFKLLEGAAPNNEIQEQATTAVITLNNNKSNPDQLWLATFRIFNLLYKNPINSTIEFEKIVTSRWETAATEQRFAFRIPRTSCPNIIDACKSTSHSNLAKVAHILLKAKSGISHTIPDKTLTILTDYESGKTEEKPAIDNS